MPPQIPSPLLFHHPPRADNGQIKTPVQSEMPARKPPPPDEKPQRDRFIETARQIGASEDAEEFERAFRRVVKPKEVMPEDHRSRPSEKPPSS